MRRPSDFRLTFTNTVAVIHNKAGCRFYFVFVQKLLGGFTSGTRLKVLEMTWFEDTRSWYQDRGNLEEIYSLKIDSIWFSPHFLLCTDSVCASGLRNYLACDPLDFRFRPQEYGPTEIDQRNPTLIICSGPWKRIHCW